MKQQVFEDISKCQKADIYPALTDSYSYIISQLAIYNQKILFVASDETKLEAIAQQLNFFNSKLSILIFPSWDCAPYDNISPNINNLIKRINALDYLSRHQKDSVVILCSSNILIQKLPPIELIPALSKTIKVNDNLNRDELVSLLIQLSFRRVEVASEPGDFAIRGDIIDIVSKLDEGWRLDFFASKLERIRKFDLASQVSSGGSLEQIRLLPSSEVVLNPQTIAHFKQAFVKEFGSIATEHPLYQAIEAGRKYPGMEHYLPCFYPKLSDLFDYFSPDQIICDHNLANEFSRDYQNVETHYQGRQELQINRFKDEVIHYPVSPQSMWISAKELEEHLFNYKLVQCHHFNLDQQTAFNLGIKKAEDFNLATNNKSISAFDAFKKYRDATSQKIIIACNSEGSLQRIVTTLENYHIHSYRLNCFNDYRNISGKTVGVAIFPLDHGYCFADFSIVAESDLLGEKIIRKKSKKTLVNLLADINNLQIGEYIVHQKHGIGLFSDLETISAAGVNHDCLKLLYDAGDILYIPVENLDLISRYGSSCNEIKLDKLGGVAWQHRKAKLKEKLKDIAENLIKTAAIRASKESECFIASPGAYEEFCARFHYVETEDQLNSIKDVEADLASGRPMDRLICGDVGFGKTEVAMRAAFIVTHPEHNLKQQIAIIVPTTLLARQHYQSFFKRFAGFDVNIKQLSRLVSTKEIKNIKQGLQDGSVDIVIGTHALLAKDVEFKNLGLLIVDEEQRFGVLQKEKLKKLQDNIHVLTLSATPIPRTLQMSLTGVRDLSIIATAPIDRMAVKTYIMNYDSVIIREAILREFYRGGQIFFVCPRISDINEVLPKLVALVPEIKIIVAHGQMTPNALEEIMTDFYNKKFNLLLSTSIIESGIDIAEANTMFIHRADKFGLSALYQLRGRVGRSNIKAFAYLLLPNKKLSKLATARLEVMQTLDTLGAGFSVASHDMDIRGFGNLVGDEQSGHVREVGLELYQEMLEQAIMNLKSDKKADAAVVDTQYSPQINLGLPVMLPETYIADLNLRLSIYRHLAALKSEDEIDGYQAEMIDRFGRYPLEVEYLLSVIKLKLKAKELNIEKIDAGQKAITFAFRDHSFAKPEKLLEFITNNQAFVKLRADHKLLINRQFNDAKEQIKFIEDLLAKLKNL